MSKSIYIVDGIRTAIGNFLGSLKAIPAHMLTAELIKAIIKRNKLSPDNISEVILGQVLTGGVGQNPARQASIAGGLPYNVPAFLINQVCGSGLRSIVIAMQNIMSGYGSLMLAGGQESMSMSNHAMHLRNKKMGNITAIDMMLNDGLIDAFHNYHMGITAENLVKKYKITRKEQDQFAYNSQIKASKAQKAGKFKDEIISIAVKQGNFKEDEFIRYISYCEANKENRDGILAVTEFIDDEKPLCVSVNEEMIIQSFDDELTDQKFVTGGIYFFSPEVFEVMDDAINSGMSRLRNFQRLLLKQDFKLEAFPFNKIVDVDHVSDIEKAEKFLAGL